MTDKENDELSSAVLMVAVAVYVALTAMLFAGMVAAKPSIASAISTWAKDYGAIIAGVPVLVAVWVAKQQLDANRRQHVADRKHQSAMLKIPFQKEIICLAAVEEYASSIIDFDKSLSASIGAIGGTKPKLPDHLPASISIDWPHNYAPSLRSDVNAVYEHAKIARAEQIAHPTSDQTKATVEFAQFYATMLLSKVSQERKQLSQFWS